MFVKRYNLFIFLATVSLQLSKGKCKANSGAVTGLAKRLLLANELDV